jgi:hypothetical protein
MLHWCNVVHYRCKKLQVWRQNVTLFGIILLQLVTYRAEKVRYNIWIDGAVDEAKQYIEL